MKITAIITQRLIERFPQHWRQIRRLLQDSEDFRELCRDCGDCVEMQQQWHGLDTPDARKWLHEYEVLQRELEIEILRFLKEADSHD